jgi:hypothetical protein
VFIIALETPKELINVHNQQLPSKRPASDGETALGSLTDYVFISKYLASSQEGNLVDLCLSWFILIIISSHLLLWRYPPLGLPKLLGDFKLPTHNDIHCRGGISFSEYRLGANETAAFKAVLKFAQTSSSPVAKERQIVEEVYHFNPFLLFNLYKHFFKVLFAHHSKVSVFLTDYSGCSSFILQES